MIEYLKRYRKLITQLEKERIILEKFKYRVNHLQKKYQEHQNNIDYLNNKKKELEDSISQIISLKISRIKKNSIFFSLILFITFLGIISFASNFNISIILSTSIYSIIGYFILYIYGYTLLENSYRRKNKKIIALYELIKNKELEINCYKYQNNNLIEERKIAVINYTNQKYKVQQIENTIKEILIDYATPIFDREIEPSENKKSSVKKLEKIN